MLLKKDLWPSDLRMHVGTSVYTPKIRDGQKNVKEEFGTGNGEGEEADGKCQVADDKCQVADDEWQKANDECQVAEGKLQVAGGEPKSPIQNPKSPREPQVAGGELKTGDQQCEVEAGGCDQGQSGEPMTEGSFGPIVGYDSTRVIDESTNDKNGILSHEGVHAAGQRGTGRWRRAVPP